MIKLIRDQRGCCRVFEGNEALLELHPDRFSLWFVPENGEQIDQLTGKPLVPEPIEEPKTSGLTERQKKIVEAVQQIDRKNYSKPTAGRPSIPKVAAVQYLCGFPVTVKEVQAAVTGIYD